MEVEIDFTKSINDNASLYFNKSKRIKKKLEGAKRAVEEYKEKLKKVEKKEKEKDNKKLKKKIIRKKFWYEKFRWFFTSEGFLVIGGKDATTNEIIIKKFTDKDDLVFHTDLAGSPFFVIKKHFFYDNLGEEKLEKNIIIGKTSKEETAIVTACFSKAWKLGLNILEVFYAKPEQLTKTPKSGEYIKKGSFVVRGKLNYINAITTNFYIGLEKYMYKEKESFRIIVGPENVLKKYSIIYFRLEQSKRKRSDVAKEIIKKIKKKKNIDIHPDEIIKSLPGGVKISDTIDIERIRILEKNGKDKTE